MRELTELQLNCYRDLYRASIGGDEQPGNFDTLFEKYGEKLPYWKYYISEYKLHRIVDEYAQKLNSVEEMTIFKDSIYMGLAPSSSYNSWIRAIRDSD